MEEKGRVKRCFCAVRGIEGGEWEALVTIAADKST
jgi:hypothetical protein